MLFIYEIINIEYDIMFVAGGSREAGEPCSLSSCYKSGAGAVLEEESRCSRPSRIINSNVQAVLVFCLIYHGGLIYPW